MSARGQLLKTFSERKVSWSTITTISERFKGKTIEERERMAAELTKEIEAKYPLIEERDSR